MKTAKPQRAGEVSRIGRQSAVLLLLFTVCFVSVLHTCDVNRSSASQASDVSTHVATQGRPPNSILHGIRVPRLETAFSRAVHWAMTSALNIPASLPSLARRIESACGRHVLSMLMDSGLEVRAPPQFLLV